MELETHVLDWRPRFNPESLNYRIRFLQDAPLSDVMLKGRSRVWKRTIWLDQGREGACTGFGLSHVLGTTPRRRGGVDNAFAQQRYYRARQFDEWPGENYDGSSVLGAMEGAKADGLIKSYHWATTLAEIVYAVSYKGPVEIGVNWYTGMFNPNLDGFLKPTGKVEGGHALAIGGISMTDRFFWLYNSWGQDWGINGAAKLSFDDMDRLLHESGEASLALKPVSVLGIALGR